MSKGPFGFKLIAVFFLLVGLFAIFTVIGEIKELDTVSTPLRISDIIIRLVIAVISPIGAYGLWNTKEWGLTISLGLVALNIVLRSLIFFSPHFSVQDEVSNAIAIALFVVIAFYIYTKRELFKKSEM